MYSDINTVPSPRPADKPLSTHSPTPSRNSSFRSHTRRDSLPVSPYHLTSPRAIPVPVPQRNGRGSMSSSSDLRHRKEGSLGGSLGLLTGSPGTWSLKSAEKREVEKECNTGWLYVAAEDVLDKSVDGGVVRVIKGSTGMEEAVDILIKDTIPCLLVEKAPGVYGFFNYTDLNSFLLLVLQAASQTDKRPVLVRADSGSSDSAIEEEEASIVKSLRRGERVSVGEICDISQKNPYHSVPAETPIRSVLPIFASGVHRIALTSDGPPRVLTSAALLEYLISLPEGPSTFGTRISSSGLPLHPLVSLPGTASVMDAMQIMSLEGLSALGVLSGTGRVRSESGSSSGTSSGQSMSPPLVMQGSPSLDEVDGGDLVSIVTARECASLVVPSEGKQVLGMGLEQMVKTLQVTEEGGRDRGEERVPVNMVTPSTTLLHASHLILATSSSRVFLKAETLSPPISPVPSFSMSSSPPVSPSIASLSLHDYNQAYRTLPRPPPTQISPHHVISILDILSCLAKAFASELAPLELKRETTWDLDPAGMGKRRRASSFADEAVGFGKWRWAGE